jgi:hypothetical protein
MNKTTPSSKPSDKGVFPNEVELSSFDLPISSTEIRPLPKEQKVGRALILQAAPMQESLFAALEREQQLQNGEVCYSNLPKVISEYDFRAYLLAAQTILFDQSYLTHNEDINSGYKREVSNLQFEENKTNYNGNIKVTLTELCRVGYGIPEGQRPSTTQRKNMAKVVEAVHNNPISIDYADGNGGVDKYLILILDKVRGKGNIPVGYNLVLNPIFTTNSKGYGILLRGWNAKLSNYLLSVGKTKKGGKSAAHLAFAQLAAIQHKGKDWSISLESLLRHLNLLDYYKEHKKKVIEKLESIFEAFVAIGVIKKQPTIEGGIYTFEWAEETKKLSANKESPEEKSV